MGGQSYVSSLILSCIFVLLKPIQLVIRGGISFNFVILRVLVKPDFAFPYSFFGEVLSFFRAQIYVVPNVVLSVNRILSLNRVLQCNGTTSIALISMDSAFSHTPLFLISSPKHTLKLLIIVAPWTWLGCEVHIINKCLRLFLLGVKNEVTLLLPLVKIKFFVSPAQLGLQLLHKEVLRLTYVYRMIVFLRLEVLFYLNVFLHMLGDRAWIYRVLLFLNSWWIPITIWRPTLTSQMK